MPARILSLVVDEISRCGFSHHSRCSSWYSRCRVVLSVSVVATGCVGDVVVPAVELVASALGD